MAISKELQALLATLPESDAIEATPDEFIYEGIVAWTGQSAPREDGYLQRRVILEDGTDFNIPLDKKSGGTWSGYRTEVAPKKPLWVRVYFDENGQKNYDGPFAAKPAATTKRRAATADAPF